MAGKRTRTKARKKRSIPRLAHKGEITVEHDHELRLAGQAVLTTIRRIKGKIEDEPGPKEQRRLRRILTTSLRKMRAYREAFAALAFEIPQIVDRQLVEQLSTFVLLEDEFESDGLETRENWN